MAGKSILITGCSSGIGRDAAHTLSRRGWRVFATCRKAPDCRRLEDEGLESFVLDNEDETSIRRAVDECLNRTGGTLDALYNNGAYAIPAAVEDLPRDALRANFEANVFGYMDLIARVVPVMRRQGHGRIVNCSSVLGFVALPFRGAYVATKFALEGLTDTLRLELGSTPIKVILIQPGPITTRFRANSLPQFERWIQWQESALRPVYETRIIPRLREEDPAPDFGELPPSRVTRKLVHALESRRPKPRYQVTTPTYLLAALRRILTTRAMDRLLIRH